MQSSQELLQIVGNLDDYIKDNIKAEFNDTLQSLLNAINQIDDASSGSWFGYHANVYYKDLLLPPAGRHFSREWGLKDVYGDGTRGDWVEYTQDFIEKKIFTIAGVADLKLFEEIAVKSQQIFEDNVSEVLSILTSEISTNNDEFITNIKLDINKLESIEVDEILNRWNPCKGAFTRDAIAHGQGTIAPAHRRLSAKLIKLSNSIASVKELSKFAKKAASHLNRKNQKKETSIVSGNKVFIGHGRSQAWKDLKDFIKDKLNLEYDEFNKIPVAGVTTISRLSEMLESAAFAFIILTAEDEQYDGKFHARMNCIHEVGLFQGKLGFDKAIILLEEGCEEFSNIAGLNQIRFPKGNISAKFEDIRDILNLHKIKCR